MPDYAPPPLPFSKEHDNFNSNSWYRRPPPINASIIFVVLLFPISTVFILWTLSTLPISIPWPRNISDLAQLGRELQGYSRSGTWPLIHVALVMSLSAIWKHAWSIPGSVFWVSGATINVLAGALFSPLLATILLATLTMFGSACATLLSKPLGPFLAHISPVAIDMTRVALSGSYPAIPDSETELRPKPTSAWIRLSVLRLIGVVPWSGINIACGVCNVPLTDCMLGAFIGCLPWTAVTCQIGDILQTVASSPSPASQSLQSLITTPEILVKLVLLTGISLAPILGRSKLQNIISIAPTPTGHQEARWAWVREWKSKISFSQRPPMFGGKEKSTGLESLVDEKRWLEATS